MKKRYALLLATALLLTGCSGDTEQLPEQTSVMGEQTTSVPEETKPAESTTAPEESTPPKDDAPAVEEKNYTVPGYIELSYEEVARLSLPDIRDDISYDIPIDITADPDFAWTLEYVSTLPEEEQELWRSQNYHSMTLSCTYIGGAADWLCVAEYSPCFYDGKFDPYYTCIFYSDGTSIGEEILAFEGHLNTPISGGMMRVGDEVFISGDKLYRYDISAMQLDVISDTNSSYMDSNDSCIVYTCHEENCAKIYDRKTGNIVTTDIYMGYYDGTMTKLTDTGLLYFAGDVKDTPVISVHLETGEEVVTQFGLYHLTDHTLKNERYTFDAEISTANWSEFTVTDNATGEERMYSVSTFPEEIELIDGKLDGNAALQRDWLYIHGDNGMITVIDLADNTIGQFTVEGFPNFYDYGVFVTDPGQEGSCVKIDIADS